ncbi:signal peptidase I [Haloferax sp. MBLA0076]|uniref:Signal peptidase I n=1 Tax=Haloferax litoreum TaxID=2666140 RepID=A0A6A8GG28_9EURY|nr:MULTISPECIES: signal peptidase I [Haloferax]KAB1193252.1 signal peptidase I [Haloferax sp. CBA1148]MRX21751.1 signal peptidase I [Haloferax litoreum]
MKVSEFVEYAVLGLFLIAVVALLFGQALGQPILLGYVETGSMEPTMEPGDGFVAVPSVLTDSPDAGDVVVFRSEELHGGGLTTHRVVRHTSDGYITRGDANPFTDQDNVEPPVTDSRIVAEALQLNGEVVVVPGLGTGVQTIHVAVGAVVGVFAGLPGFESLLRGEFSPMLLVGIGGGLIALSVGVDLFGSSRPAGKRTRSRPNYVSIGVVLFVLVVLISAPATVSMLFGSGTTTVDIISSESPAENPLVVEPGDAATVEYRLTNKGYIPMMTVVESTHPDVTFGQSVFVVSGQQSTTTTLSIRAPEQTGAYTREITEQRYLPILPKSLILGLHDIHPLVAIAVIDALLVVGALALGIVTLGMTPVRMRTVGRNISFVERLKRRFL